MDQASGDLKKTPLPSQIEVKMKLRVFTVPPFNDALVIGKNAPIGSEAWRRALVLLQVAPFESIKIDDEVVEEILIQKRIMKKIPRENLVAIVLKKVKPFMTPEEVIHLDIGVELSIDEVI
jgi:hypothetical protein